jgi:hypothetical protein
MAGPGKRPGIIHGDNRQEIDMANHWIKAARIPLAAAALTSLLVAATPAFAAFHSFETSRGPAFITGNFGSMQTTTIPGSGAQGMLMSNGNGTSTLLAPGMLPQVVATPR